MKLTSTLMMCAVCMMLLQFTESVQQMQLEKRAAQENYIFLENLLFESEARSVIGCALICWKTPACLMFTVTVTSLGKTCRGHAVVMTSASPGTWTASTSFWITNWLGRECSSDAECGVPLSECFAGRCLCSPGYYFSNSKRVCVEGCAEADLQSSFLTYPGHVIIGNNIGPENCPMPVLREECLALCGHQAAARTCDFSVNLWCCLQAVTKRDAPGSWSPDENLTHYQKTCL